MKIEFRNLESQDRKPLERMLAHIHSFDPADRALALELINIGLDQADQKDYLFILATGDQGRLVGYACYGPTPLTDGTFDLYWIAVDPEYSGQGIGSLLLQAVEGDVRLRHGRLLIVETSSGENYGQACNFYQKNDYDLVERIGDFYRPGEDRLTYLKRL